MRKVNLPVDSNAKVVKPRLLHGTQWGMIDPMDTPDGGNVGFHKHLAISTRITAGTSKTDFIGWLDKTSLMTPIQHTSLAEQCFHTRYLLMVH